MFLSNPLSLIKMFGRNSDEETKNYNEISNEDNYITTNKFEKIIFNFGVYDFNNDTSMNLLNIMHKEYNINDNVYKLLNYKKTSLTNDKIDTIGKFRSLLIENNKIVMFSPPKSLSYSLFVERYNDVEKQCNAEEIIEGTMINLFYINNKWEISTKSTFGGNTIFFKEYDTTLYKNGENNKIKTFRDMFFEIIENIKFNIDSLDKKYCYSFVMQHPENRIVLPIYSMSLYLIKVYKIDNISRIVYDIDFKNNKELTDIFNGTLIKFPIKYEMNTFDDLKKNYTLLEWSFNCLGIMIYSPDGNRTKLINNIYQDLKELRGNNCKLQYHYLNLRKKGNEYIKKYLYHFQEHEDLFNIYKMQLHNYTYKLYNYYVECFIKKDKKLNQLPYNYRKNVYTLHSKYIDFLRPYKKCITLAYVINYINELDSKLQMYYLNYDMRSIDKNIKND
jgi:hypothetical protein